MQYIAPYVLRSEYACRCCGRVPPEVKGDYMELPIFYWQLFDFFGSLRRAWDKPITISSGYRCPKHNQEIGGVPLSLHIFGGALDLKFKDSEETARAARQVDESCPNVRMGVYLGEKNYLHIDIAQYVIPKLSDDWDSGARWGSVYSG